MRSLSKRISFTYCFDLLLNLKDAHSYLIWSVWAQKSSLWPLLDLRRIKKRWSCPLLVHLFSLRLLKNLLLDFYSFSAIRCFYLSRFDLIICTFLDIILMTKTHADVWILKGKDICLLMYWINSPFGKISMAISSTWGAMLRPRRTEGWFQHASVIFWGFTASP